MYPFWVYSVCWDYYTLIMYHMLGAVLEELELHTPHAIPIGKNVIHISEQNHLTQPNGYPLNSWGLHI